MPSFVRDVRYAMRNLWKHPGVALIATLALTMGIGLTTTMYSIVYGAFIHGLPFPDGDRIVVVSRQNPSRGIRRQALPIQDFVDYRAQQRSFTDIGGYTTGTMYVSGAEKAERFNGAWITADAFGVLGEHPILGRDFRAGEDTPSGAKVVMLSYGVWRDRYHGDSAVVGRAIRVNGQPFTVIGVMPSHFAFPDNTDLWLPVQDDPLAGVRGQGQYLSTFARLRPGASIASATADVATIAARLAAKYPDANGGFSAGVQGFIDSAIGPEPHQLLMTMLGAVFLVLLIACANVANLLLDRAAHRSKEVGIRTALGATRGAVAVQFLAEALVLSAAATVLGVAAAYFGIAAFNRAIAPTQPPFFIDIRLYPQVLLFTIGVAVLTTLVAGAIPAYQASRADITAILKDESRGASSFHVGRISRVLVVLEIALSCALLVAAGLTIKSVVTSERMDFGFTSKNVFTARVGFPAAYADTVAEWAFFDRVLQGVASLPGVQHAAIASGLPETNQGFGGGTFAVEGKGYLADKDYPSAQQMSATPDYFATLGVPIAAGRAFTDADRAGSVPVAIVSRTLAHTYFGSANPIGRRIRLGGAKSTAPWMTIVGIAGDIYSGDPQQPETSVIYQPFAQAHASFAYITARTSAPPLTLTNGVRAAVNVVNADIPLYWIATLDQAIGQHLWFVRVFGTMFIIFGAMALFLASVGLYAVMSFSVSRRTREVGIRMALGAQSANVLRMIFRQGLTQLGIGMVAGLAAALGISRLLSVILFQVEPRDPMIFGSVAVLLAIVGLLACLVPGLRATRVDPLVALRSE